LVYRFMLKFRCLHGVIVSSVKEYHDLSGIRTKLVNKQDLKYFNSSKNIPELLSRLYEFFNKVLGDSAKYSILFNLDKSTQYIQLTWNEDV